jgi:carbonic anhydrase
MIIKSLLLTPVLALAFAAPVMAQEPAEVEFDYEGAIGPAFWGELSPAFAACSTGRLQSPIDIRDAQPARAPRIRMRYRPTPLVVENNGHTIEALPEREQTLVIGGKSYQLVQLHPHSPSEHTLAGRRFRMELHFVHQAADGERAVVGAFVRPGRRNEAYARIAGAAPARADEERELEERVDLYDLLPESRRAFRYSGSLTTPPCTEGIRWNVLATPVELSQRQINGFRRMLGRNARPTQPRNGRELIVG